MHPILYYTFLNVIRDLRFIPLWTLNSSALSLVYIELFLNSYPIIFGLLMRIHKQLMVWKFERKANNFDIEVLMSRDLQICWTKQLNSPNCNSATIKEDLENLILQALSHIKAAHVSFTLWGRHTYRSLIWWLTKE